MTRLKIWPVRFALIAALGFALVACKNKKIVACDEHVNCTQYFSMVTVRATNGKGVSASLDSVITIREQTKERIVATQSSEPGYLTVLDDGYVRFLQNQNDRFLLKGYQQGRTVFEKLFVISADCCHIKRVSGPDSVIVR